MAGARLFGGPPGAVTVVEPTVVQAYARKARATFLSVGLAVAVLTSAVLAVFAHPVLAVLLGILAGLLLGLVTGLLVQVWPVLRVLWWWSTEITLAGLVLVGPAVLARLTVPWLALAVVLGLAVMGVA